jgi:hypothetical protein
MDLKESARQWVLQELPYGKTDAALVAHLNGLDVHGLLVVYHNWASRLIAPRRREIHVSASLREKLATSVHKAAFDQIIEDIKAGRHLKCYLSRCVNIAAQIPRNDVKFNRRRDLDLLITEWELHYLNLSTNVEPDGFVTRTDDLLEPIREVWTPDQRFAERRRSMRRIMARRTKAAALRAWRS